MTTYKAPKVSAIISNLTLTSSISNIAKGIWLTEQVALAIEEKCTSTFFDSLELAIDSLPKGAEKISHTLPDGRVIAGERNARQSAKKSITTAFKNAVKGWKENNSTLYAKYENKNLVFKKSSPMFKNKTAPKQWEDKAFDLLLDIMSENDAHAAVNSLLKDYGVRYWERKESLREATLASDIERVNEQYQEFLSMGLSESTAYDACSDKFDPELVALAI